MVEFKGGLLGPLFLIINGAQNGGTLGVDCFLF
jgi:hypothetical protein